MLAEERAAFRGTGLASLVTLFASTYALDYGLFVLSWWLLGRGALSGDVDYGWLSLWAALFVVMLPFRMLSTWSQGKIAVIAGRVLKKRLLQGAMHLSPDVLRADGAGRHLARVFESEAVESLALGGGLLAAAASIELVVATVVLSLGAAGPWHGALLVLTLLLFAFVARGYYRQRRSWTDERLEMSHDLVERMVGHRTRLAQKRPERWHQGEDESLARYVARSRNVDRLQTIFRSIPRLWIVVGLLPLAPRFTAGDAVARLAVGLGGTILALRALMKLTDGFSDLLDARIVWERVRPLFHAADRPLPKESEASAATPLSEGALIEARGVSFRYPRRAAPVLSALEFRLQRGDRVLLTSPSGGGKSTLVSLMNGLRIPTGGVLLGAGNGSVATAPQFHENHVFTESFAFNLLMGRAWPPAPGDLALAEELARELGLDDLLEKMPGGMNQLVGETGWQLSHGERSRLFLARALLQRAELVLLDESFAALDPENLRQALLCARERAPSLLVVAHL